MVDFSVGGLILQIINTLVLYLILRKLLFNKVKGVMDSRTEKIQREIEDANILKKQAEELKQSYEEKIGHAKEEGQQIIKAATKRGEERREEIVRNAEDEARKLLERANLETQRGKQKALDELKTEIIDIALMAANKAVNASMNEQAHRKLIKEFIEEVGEA